MTAVPGISVYLITLNEGRHLDEVLASAADADEIVVVDSGSTDDTLEIARRHGARVIHQDWLGFSRQKDFALSRCRFEWALNLDGDEVLPTGAIEAIRARIAAGGVNGLYVERDDLFFGHVMNGAKRYRFRRAYRRDRAAWDTSVRVHEHIEVDPPLARTSIRLKHYGYDSVHGYMGKLNQYSLLKARQRDEQGRGCSLMRLLFIFPLMFFKFYVLRRMFLSGWRGFIKAMVDAFHFFLTEAKLYEIEYRRRRPVADE